MWSFDNVHFLMRIVLFTIISVVLCVECTVHSDGTPAIAQVSIIPDIDNFQRQRGGHRIVAATIPTPCGINMNLHLWGETKDVIELCSKFGIAPQPLQYPHPLHYGPDQYPYPPNRPYHSQQPHYEQYPQPLRSVHDQSLYNPNHPQQPQQQQPPQQLQYEQEISRLRQDIQRLQEEVDRERQRLEQCQQGPSSQAIPPHIPPEIAERGNNDQEAFEIISNPIAICIGNIDTESRRRNDLIGRMRQRMTEILTAIGEILASSPPLSEGARSKLLEGGRSIQGCLDQFTGTYDISEWDRIRETLVRANGVMEQPEQPGNADDNERLQSISRDIAHFTSNLASLVETVSSDPGLGPIQEEMRVIMDNIEEMLNAGHFHLTEGAAAKLRDGGILIQQCLGRLDHPQNVIEALMAVRTELVRFHSDIHIPPPQHHSASGVDYVDVAGPITRCLEELVAAGQEMEQSAMTGKIMQSEEILRGILRDRGQQLTQDRSMAINQCLVELERIRRDLPVSELERSKLEINEVIGRLQVVRNAFVE